MLGMASLLWACGDDSPSRSSEPEISGPDDSYATIEDLPSCTDKYKGYVALVESDGETYKCQSGKWIAVVDSEDDLLNCTDKRDGKSVYVRDVEKIVVCNKGKWQSENGILQSSNSEKSSSSKSSSSSVQDVSKSTYVTVPKRENLPSCNVSNAQKQVLVKQDSVIFKCDSEKWVPESNEGYLIKEMSVKGYALKGPFKTNASLSLQESYVVNDSLFYSGRKYFGSVSTNKGDFVISKVNMIYPYAVIEVCGFWRNEVTGNWSKDSMTLRGLVDLSQRTETNINLFTHLEYERVLKLIAKGRSFSDAKKQAEQEIVKSFGFTINCDTAENLRMFVKQNDSKYESNAALLAIVILFMGNQSDSDVYKRIDSYKRDLAEDGVWSDEKTKANMADWAKDIDNSDVRENIKSWNILDIPVYEKYLTLFWNNVYGLEECSKNNYGKVSPNTNAYSKYKGVHYICDAGTWRKATDIEKDTYGWSIGKENEVRKGDVTDLYYIVENGVWIIAKNENALGECTSKRIGEIGKIDTTYFICKEKRWIVASMLEYDTYQFSDGKEGEVRVGKVNVDKYYVYENGLWRASKNEIENNAGACVANRDDEKISLNSKYYICENKSWKEITSVEYDLGYCLLTKEGTVDKSGGIYYICRSEKWNVASILEYDTYEWNTGKEGEVRVGKVNVDKYYVYESGSWRASKNEIENGAGACIASREGEKVSLNSKFYICENKSWKEITSVEYNIGFCSSATEGVIDKSGTAYYICRSGKWEKSSALEYDTRDWNDGKEGEVRQGSVNKENYYVYEDGKWRAAANEIEKKVGACVVSREGARKVINGKYYVCENKKWKGISAIEYKLGVCNSVIEDSVGLFNSTYYICRSGIWETATVLEYDTYGRICSNDGNIVYGRINTTTAYVCDNDAFRKANNDEIALKKGCVSYTEGTSIKKSLTDAIDSLYVCSNGKWLKSKVLNRGESGKMTDPRDGKTYKTIVIGKQTWMAENLDFVDVSNYSRSKFGNWCPYDKNDSCKKYGRLYTWAAAIDSASLYQNNGLMCGSEVKCNVPAKVQGICPTGWHLPDTSDLKKLFKSVGATYDIAWKPAGKILKSTTGWKRKSNGSFGDGDDIFGFCGIPAGVRSRGTLLDAYGRIQYGFTYVGYQARFWSSNESGKTSAEGMLLRYDSDAAYVYTSYKDEALSVRCVKD